MKSKYTMDMTEGPLLGKILIFSIPLLLSGILQLLYNAADIIILGQFEGAQALAAVGSTGSLINLIVNLFVGFSVGTSVVVGRYLGAKRTQDIKETIQTAVLLALISSGICMALALPLAPTFLRWMGSPDDVIGLASLYIRIYFLGAPASLLYNFCAGILRAEGDTRRPLFILGVSGLLNVALNLVFVLGVKIGVAGVAIATISSQYLSCALVLRCLMRQDASTACRLELKGIRIYGSKLKQILLIGLPSGMQSVVFALSNTVVQSSVNSFGSDAIAGSAASANIEAFIWTAMNAISQAATSFASQNIGARKIHRLNRIYLQCLGTVTCVGLAMGIPVFLLAENFISIYNTDPVVLAYGAARLCMITPVYFLCGCQDVHTGVLRGMGYSTSPMIIALLGGCGIRILWVYTVFKYMNDWDILFASYFVSWFITTAVFAVFYQFALRRTRKKYGDPLPTPAQ